MIGQRTRSLSTVIQNGTFRNKISIKDLNCAMLFVPPGKLCRL